MNQIINKSTHIINVYDANLKADLSIPNQANAIVLFAHGSGSSRLSPRNMQVANFLNKVGIATLLFDLLTFNEDRNFSNRYNIKLLAARLKSVTEWIRNDHACRDMQIGYFGASTGTAAAMEASVDEDISAIVSRGGRPDLAMNIIHKVKTPTLLIVGSADTDVIQLNKLAFEELNAEKKLEIVPGATHLFEEKGAIEKVAVLSEQWFDMYLHPVEICR
jgi:dienelactone hydrolase